MKLIAFILVVAAAVWCYFNVDFAQIKSKTGQAVQNEKTIKTVNQTRSFHNNETQDVLDKHY